MSKVPDNLLGICHHNGYARGQADRVSRTRDRAQASESLLLAQAAGQLRPQDLPAEPLVCPACGERYAFGDACPDCDRELVGASAAHVRELSAPARSLIQLRQGLFALLCVAVVFGAPLALWLLIDLYV